MPQCGFSRAAVQVLDLHGVPAEKMKTFDVLEDSELRSGIKEFSEWPTIPQLYVGGEFVGGCDILLGSAYPALFLCPLVSNIYMQCTSQVNSPPFSRKIMSFHPPLPLNHHPRLHLKSSFNMLCFTTNDTWKI